MIPKKLKYRGTQTTPRVAAEPARSMVSILRRTALSILALSAGLLLSPEAPAAVGALDITFGATDGDGTDGVTALDRGKGGDYGRSVVIQSDGKVLLAGYAYNGKDSDIALARYNPDGTLDTGFGAGDGDGIDGLVFWDSGNGNDYGYSVALQPDGRVLVAGMAANGSDGDLLLARFTAAGKLDTTFGAGSGVVTWDSGSGEDCGNALALRPDGKVLVTGYSASTYNLIVARFGTDGTLDTTFGTGDGDGTDGVATWPHGRGEALALQAGGGALVAGYTNNEDLALARFTPDGILDTTFGASDGDGFDGVGTWDSDPTISSDFDYGHALVLQPDGKVLVAGSGDFGLAPFFALARFNADGTLDVTFGAGDGDGTDGVTTWYNGHSAEAYSVALQPDGKAVLVGEAFNGSDADLAVARFTADGALDTTFGAGDGDGYDGVAVWDGGKGEDKGRSLAIQTDGQLVVAGSLANGSDSDLLLARFLGGSWGTPAWATRPDAFTFPAQTGVKRGTRVDSDQVTLAGLGSGVRVPVQTDTGGLSILQGNGAQAHADVPFAWVGPAFQLQVHHTTAATSGDTVTSAVTAGGVRPTPRSLLLLGDTRSADFTSTANQDPAFTGGTGSVEVAEDAGTGTAVTTLTASDPEGQTLSFALTAGNTAGKFALDGTTGKLTVAAGLDFDTTPNSYPLDVKVSDPVDGEATGTVTVNVTRASGKSGGGGGGGGCALAPSGGAVDPLWLALPLLGFWGLRRRAA